jgi:hypothetical protein
MANLGPTNKRSLRISPTTLYRAVAGSTPDLEFAEKSRRSWYRRVNLAHDEASSHAMALTCSPATSAGRSATGS